MVRASKCVVVATATIGILSLIIVFMMLSELDILERLTGREEDEGELLSHHYVTEATKFTSLDDTAYIFLGLGATAHQMNCPAAIESLVRYGGWGGKVYMVTDQENCFDKDLMVKNAGMKPENFEMLVVKEDFGGGGIDISNPKVGFSKNRLKSKSMKTQLFDLVTDQNIKVLAYADCDMIFAQEGCAYDYVAGGVPWEERNIRFSRVTVDPPTGRLANIHTGTITMHREHSKEVLQRWYERLNSGVGDMDRASFLFEYNAIQDEIERRHQTGNNSLVKPIWPSRETPDYLRKRSEAYTANAGRGSVSNFIPPVIAHSPEKNVMMPSERIMFNNITGNITRYEVFINPAMEELPCMIHVSKARCELFGRDAIHNFLKRFRLRTYNQGYQYCPNPIVAPILYGWFPLSYLPFCPKIEIFH